jgi:hypothetical protein
MAEDAVMLLPAGPVLLNPGLDLERILYVKFVIDVGIVKS